MEPIIYVLFFVSAFLAAEGLFMVAASGTASRRSRAARRLRRLASRLRARESPSDGTLLRPERERLPLLEWINRRIPGRRTVELRLYRAGMATTPARLMAVCGALGAGGVALGTILSSDALLAACCGGVALLPWIHAGRVASKRMKRFEEQFPEALELMTRALRAGHSLTFAFQLVGDELPDPIGREFAHVSEEIKLGQDLRVALANLSYRINVGDLPYFTTAVMVQRETGGNLAELLDSLGYVIRDRFKLFGKVRSLTAVGKATANILGVWPLLMVLLLYMVGADFVALLWETRTGNLLAISAVAMVIVGYTLCRRAAEIRV